mgnify:CR=1 FL=1
MLLLYGLCACGIAHLVAIMTAALLHFLAIKNDGPAVATIKLDIILHAES